MLVVVQPMMTIDMLLMFLFTFIAALGTSGVIVSLFIWDNPNNDEEEDEEEDEELDFPYKYWKEFDKLEDKELTEEFVESLVDKTLVEETPKDKVIMFYDANLMSFVYYCDTKDVPYKYLETVARNYVISYDCKQLYIDIRKEINEGIARRKEEAIKNIEKKESGEKEDNGLFATLKPYNKKAGGKKKSQKYFILKEKSNRYSYRGRFEDYDNFK